MAARRRAPDRSLRPASIALVLALSACVNPFSDAPGTSPRPAAAPSIAGSADGAATTSQALAGPLADYYAERETDLRRAGRLQVEATPAALPSAEDLAAGFVEVALSDELDPQSGGPVERGRPGALRRWEGPVRVSLEFGASVPEDLRRQDRAAIAALLADLSDLTGRSVALTGGAGNFTLVIAGSEDLAALGPRLNSRLPGIPPEALRAITGLPARTPCLAAGFATAQRPFVYTRAIAVVRAEQPPFSRLSCYHEEIAQGLGLVNDSPDLRPSVFNDDEEYALLTGLDRALLKMLYDPRLKPGMTVEAAAPLLGAIADDVIAETGGAAEGSRES